MQREAARAAMARSFTQALQPGSSSLSARAAVTRQPPPAAKSFSSWRSLRPRSPHRRRSLREAAGGRSRRTRRAAGRCCLRRVPPLSARPQRSQALQPKRWRPARRCPACQAHLLVRRRQRRRRCRRRQGSVAPAEELCSGPSSWLRRTRIGRCSQRCRPSCCPCLRGSPPSRRRRPWAGSPSPRSKVGHVKAQLHRLRHRDCSLRTTFFSAYRQALLSSYSGDRHIYI
mmetsp:Transcript_225/g.565  ORF Transcript_225/g.565 Transcript_225/m.565 type:complete len:229 (-) Transcript_225:38-724(-)